MINRNIISVLFIGSLLSFAGCNGPSSSKSISTYQIGLLEQQPAHLTEKKAVLIRKTILNGVEKVDSLVPQNTGEWRNILNVFVDGNINQSVYQGYFETETLSGDGLLELHVFKSSHENLPISRFEELINPKTNEILEIETVISATTFLTNLSKKYHLWFEKEELRSFELEVVQQSKIGQPIHLTISAKIILPDSEELNNQ